ncbi:hypothetical protein HK101_009392 [Irineochytrium annulatum]|nr:hypothetical protein HK101_009392 [Irineochytrium annulatum]
MSSSANSMVKLPIKITSVVLDDMSSQTVGVANMNMADADGVSHDQEMDDLEATRKATINNLLVRSMVAGSAAGQKRSRSPVESDRPSTRRRTEDSIADEDDEAEDDLGEVHSVGASEGEPEMKEEVARINYLMGRPRDPENVPTPPAESTEGDNTTNDTKEIPVDLPLAKLGFEELKRRAAAHATELVMAAIAGGKRRDSNASTSASGSGAIPQHSSPYASTSTPASVDFASLHKQPVMGEFPAVSRKSHPIPSVRPPPVPEPIDLNDPDALLRTHTAWTDWIRIAVPEHDLQVTSSMCAWVSAYIEREGLPKVKVRTHSGPTKRLSLALPNYREEEFVTEFLGRFFADGVGFGDPLDLRHRHTDVYAATASAPPTASDSILTRPPPMGEFPVSKPAPAAVAPASDLEPHARTHTAWTDWIRIAVPDRDLQVTSSMCAWVSSYIDRERLPKIKVRTQNGPTKRQSLGLPNERQAEFSTEFLGRFYVEGIGFGDPMELRRRMREMNGESVAVKAIKIGKGK